MRPAATPEPLYRLPTYQHADAQGIWLLAFGALVLDVAASLLLAGGLVAGRWRWVPQLGRPWLEFEAYPELQLVALTAAAAVALVGLVGAAVRRYLHGVHCAAGGGPPASWGWTGTASLIAVPLTVPAILIAGLAATAPLYPPLAWLRWSARYQGSALLARDLDQTRAVLFGTLAGLLAVTLGAAVLRLSGLRETGDSHGSSHWASPREVAATGLLAAPASRARRRQRRHPDPARRQDAGGGEGSGAHGGAAAATARPASGEVPGAVVVGAWYGRAPGERRPRLHHLYDRRDRHVIAFAPSGSGKSTCLVVPTLLAWPHSAVILDVKGELWHLTAGYRARKLGHRCLRLDLACADGSAARYNPLLAVPRGAEDVKHAQSIADTLVDPDGRDQPRTFWDQSAHTLLTALILHVVYIGDEPTLAACARLLSDPTRTLNDTLDLLLTAPHDPTHRQGWRRPGGAPVTATHPLVAATARNLLDLDPRTMSGIVATAQAHLSLFRDPVLAANTAASDFEPLDLVTGDQPLDLYLTLAPADLNRLRGPIRIVLNQLCRALTERLDFHADSGRPRRHPLLLLLDEFTILGRLDFFGRAMAYLRGYGIRVYLSIQALSQLYDIYGRHQSITANCPVQVAFTPADLETAELLSRMTGPTTIHLAKRALANAPLSVGPRRHTLSLQEHARPLLTAEEMRRLPDTEALVFVTGHAPIRGRREPYFHSPHLVQCCLTVPEPRPPSSHDQAPPSAVPA
jgi:type IV secretory pathway TraG/TraD family ATPase VirD4